MSATAATAYRSRFADRIAPAGSRKKPENKPFRRGRSAFSGKAHCIKDSVLLDDTCGGGGFLAGTEKQQRGDTE